MRWRGFIYATLSIRAGEIPTKKCPSSRIHGNGPKNVPRKLLGVYLDAANMDDVCILLAMKGRKGGDGFNVLPADRLMKT